MTIPRRTHLESVSTVIAAPEVYGVRYGRQGRPAPRSALEVPDRLRRKLRPQVACAIRWRLPIPK